MLTSQDLQKILREIRLLSIKDSTFQRYDKALETDEVSILRPLEGVYQNIRVPLKDAVISILPIVQTTGTSTTDVMSQNAVTTLVENTVTDIEDKLKEITDTIPEVVQTTGDSTESVMSQDATTKELNVRVKSETVKGVEVVYGDAPLVEDNIIYIELEETA